MSIVFDNINHAPTVDGPPAPRLRFEIDVTNKPTNPVRVWTDITPFVRYASYTRAGRTSERETTQPGSYQVTLDNRPDSEAAIAAGGTGKPFDRDNPDGPFFPGLQWSFWVRFTTLHQDGEYVEFAGLKGSLAKTRPSLGADDEASLSGPDAMKPLELFALGGLTLAQAQAGGRIGQVLGAASMPAGNIDVGYPRLIYPQAVFAAGDTTSALSHLQAIEQDERGLLFARGDGKIEFQGRYYRTLLVEQGPLATIGEDAGTIGYRDGDYTDSGDFRFNSVSVTPAGGTAEVSRDQSSIDEAFELRLPMSMLVESQVAAKANANWYLNRYSRPAQRVGRLTISGSLRPEMWPVILSAGNSDLFTWAGPNGVVPVHLERVAHTWNFGQPPVITWDLSPAGRDRVWRLGIVGESELGETTREG